MHSFHLFLLFIWVCCFVLVCVCVWKLHVGVCVTNCNCLHSWYMVFALNVCLTAHTASLRYIRIYSLLLFQSVRRSAFYSHHITPCVRFLGTHIAIIIIPHKYYIWEWKWKWKTYQAAAPVINNTKHMRE